MTTLGAIFLPQLPPERLPALAGTADRAGLAELWLWEDCFFESGIAAAATALARTDRLRVGIGLLPVPLRNVALTAMEIATLERLFPGRVVVGIGHGVLDWMAQVGARVESPMTLLREYATALRALLRGEEVTVDGRYVRLAGVRLDWPPAAPPPVYVGAQGPRTLRLAGELGDGTVLSAGLAPDRIRAAVGHVRDGLAAAGRTGAHPVVAYLHAATGPTAVRRLASESKRWGYESIEDFSAAGDAAAVAATVHRWAEAGVDTVALQPTQDDPDPEGFIRFVATEVAPLV